MIRTIEIENIKGIGSGDNKKTFNLDILPNKPSLLIAPNGYGKSSLSIAFKSLNRNRIDLEEDDYYIQDTGNRPVIRVRFQNDDGTTIDLFADETSNTISDVFDYFVINNQLKAKGIGRSFGGRTQVSASMTIPTIILIDSIPTQINLNYSVTNYRAAFGNNGKALPNLNNIFGFTSLFSELQKPENITILDRTGNKTVQDRINSFKDRVNQQSGNITKQVIIEWIRDNEIDFLSTTPYLSDLSNILQKFDLDFQVNKEVESYLASLQLIVIYHLNKQSFKDFCKRKEYERDKEGYKDLFKNFNSTWLEFNPIERDNSLVLEFPKANLISNGERDILCFLALLEKAKKKLKKENSILIIDEVFDYLDDANLVAAQYYATQFIESFKGQGKNLYLLILTHLDPLYFKGYVFGRKNKLKIYYLDKSEATVNEHLIKILKERNNSTSILKRDIERYLLHFHTTQIDRRRDFEDLNLKPTWGELNNFDNYIFEEARKYCNDEVAFDPLAVCCAVRKNIEKNVYNLIIEGAHKIIFLDEMIDGTNKKLEFAERIGVQVDETYYFLGIIYNEALHWYDNRDNISPVVSRLKNLTIKNIIKAVFQ